MLCGLKRMKVNSNSSMAWLLLLYVVTRTYSNINYIVVYNVVMIGSHVDGVTNRLLLKVLASLEDVKQTQKLQSSLIQSILRQMKASDSHSGNELPDGIVFPLTTFQDVDKIEQQLADTATRKTLVCTNMYFEHPRSECWLEYLCAVANLGLVYLSALVYCYCDFRLHIWQTKQDFDCSS